MESRRDEMINVLNKVRRWKKERAERIKIERTEPAEAVSHCLALARKIM